MDRRQADAKIEKLRGYRVFSRDDSITGELLKQTRSLIKLHRALDGIGEQWGTLLPRELAARTRIEGLSRGVLAVRVPDSATDYELDRWLRSGGLDALQRSGAAIKKVKTMFMSPDAPSVRSSSESRTRRST